MTDQSVPEVAPVRLVSINNLAGPCGGERPIRNKPDFLDSEEYNMDWAWLTSGSWHCGCGDPSARVRLVYSILNGIKKNDEARRARDGTDILGGLKFLAALEYKALIKRNPNGKEKLDKAYRAVGLNPDELAAVKKLKRIPHPRDKFDTAVWQFIALTLETDGLLEHGSNTNYAWLTEKGKNWLRTVEKYKTALLTRWLQPPNCGGATSAKEGDEWHNGDLPPSERKKETVVP